MCLVIRKKIAYFFLLSILSCAQKLDDKTLRIRVNTLVENIENDILNNNIGSSIIGCGELSSSSDILNKLGETIKTESFIFISNGLLETTEYFINKEIIKLNFRYRSEKLVFYEESIYNYEKSKYRNVLKGEIRDLPKAVQKEIERIKEFVL